MISEYTQGSRTKSNIYLGSQVLAVQTTDGTTSAVGWESFKPGLQDNITTASNSVIGTRTLTDPMYGVNVGISDPSGGPTDEGQYAMGGLMPGLAASLDAPMCQIDGMDTSCATVHTALLMGGAEECPNNYCGIVGYMWNGQMHLSVPFTSLADGISGYFPSSSDSGLTPQQWGEGMRGGWNTGMAFYFNGQSLNPKAVPFVDRTPAFGEFSSRGGDDLPCPPRDSPSFTANGGIHHYTEGSGNPVYISIDEIQADFPMPSSFPEIQKLVDKGTGGKSSVVININNLHSGPVQTKTWQSALLGRITFDIKGTLKIYEFGLAEFKGTMGVIPDPYDFDYGDRGIVANVSTLIGSALPGTPYDIITVGRYSVTQEWTKHKSIRSSCKEHLSEN